MTLFSHLFSVGDIRLVDGSAPNQGRVEVYVNGSWWTVCDDWFGYDEGRVVCRQLGLPQLTQVYRRAAFGQGNGSILSEAYNCRGNESSLLSCYKSGGHYYCGHWEDVGIACGQLVTTGMQWYNLTNLVL